VLVSDENGSRAVTTRPDRTPLSRRDPVALAQHFFDSGFFPDLKSFSQAVVKIVAGEELGIGAMTSMQGIHIIKGKPSMSANLLGVKVKQTERYNFRPVEVDDKHAKIAWFEHGEEVGYTEFTIEQAKKAKLIAKDSGWEKYPEDMLFARALTRGIRRFCPEVTAGSPAYTPEELGAPVDEQGDPVVVESEAEVITEKLPPERVAHLIEGIEIVKPALAENSVNWLDGLNVLLGSLGIDGFEPGGDLEAELGALSEGDADQLDTAIQSLADEEAAKVEAAR
jgi:hypothetical protein